MDNRILVVDDALFMRMTIRKILISGGYTRIDEASNGEEALALYEEKHPDLVLLDITMPGMSGIEVLEEILKAAPEANVVMCSAVGQEMMIQKALVAGAKDFIVKPFKPEEFLRVVNHSMSKMN